MRKKTKIKILVGYHKPAYLLKDEVLTPIHLGRALAMSASKDGVLSAEDYQWLLDNMIGDDTGNNISKENRKFCELTALYWAWKNYDKLGNPDYIGFMQYRRHLIFDDDFEASGLEKSWGCYCFDAADEEYCRRLKLSGKEIAAYIKAHPADILTTREVVFEQTVAAHYAKTLSFLNPKDLETCIEKTGEIFPDDAIVARHYMKSKKHYWYHCFVMKKEVFFEYCRWLFAILQATEKEINYRGYPLAAKRTIAYLGERLWGVFLNRKKKSLVILHLDLSLIQNDYFRPQPAPVFAQNDTAVVFACDGNYAPYLAVALQSLAEHADPANNYDIVVLENGVDDYCQKMLRETYGRDNISIRFYDVNGLCRRYEKLFYHHTYYSPAVYFRFFIPGIFSAYRQVLYLDCDLVCLRDIAALCRQELGQSLLGVVRDIEYLRIYNENETIRKYCDTVLKMKDYTAYFNSGVLCFNIEQCQKFRLTQKLLQKLEKVGKPMIVDQDIFNAVCEGRVCYLEQNWNVEWHSYYMYGNLLPYQVPEVFYRQYLQAVAEPFILHYAVDIKPWNCPEHATAEIFWHYAAKTPFFAQIVYKHFEQKIYALSVREKGSGNLLQPVSYKDRLKYYRYKFLAAVLFGGKKRYYSEKKKKLKQKIKTNRRLAA